MSKLFALCWLLVNFSNAFCQEQYKIYTWEEAQLLAPDSVFALSFRKMKLESLPKNLINYRNLRQVDFSRNKFTVFPVEILELEHLEKLIFNRNRIEIIPDSISKLKNLVYIDFWDNPIPVFPETFLNMSTLKEIHAEGIKYGPKFHQKWITALPNVKLFLDPPCDCRE